MKFDCFVCIYLCVHFINPLMLVTIPPKMSVSKFMGILKGKGSLMIFDQFANLNTSTGTGIFGAEGIM